MTAHTIRVRVDPSSHGEYVILGDAEDADGQRWLGQRPGGRWDGWDYHHRVAYWPEFELTIPGRTDLDLEREGRRAGADDCPSLLESDASSPDLPGSRLGTKPFGPDCETDGGINADCLCHLGSSVLALTSGNC